jgi:hypothetical protein
MTVEGASPSQVEELDPLASLTAPPKNETKVERFIREQREVFAKHISDRIDEHLNGEKAKAANRKPTRKQVRVLLLGQRASGRRYRFSLKATRLTGVIHIRKVDHHQAYVNPAVLHVDAFLKSRLFFSPEIQLTYAPRAARYFWTSVVQLNLMQNVADILSIIDQEMATQPSSSSETYFSLEFIRQYSSINLQLNFLNTTRTKLARQLCGPIGVSDDSDSKGPDRRTNEEIGATLAGFVNVIKMLRDDDTVQKTLGASLRWQEVTLSSCGL